jgi:hypothetical protein
MRCYVITSSMEFESISQVHGCDLVAITVGSVSMTLIRLAQEDGS